MSKVTAWKKASRQDRAKKLAEARGIRTPHEQIAHLDKLLGVGVGAKRERARLVKLLVKPTN